MKSFSEHLRYLMSLQNVSAAELARRCGLSEAAISGYLHGKKEPRGAQSISLARALGVSLDELWQTEFAKAAPAVQSNAMSSKERDFLSRLRLLNDEGLRKLDVYLDDLLNSGHEYAPSSDLQIAARSGGVSKMTPRQRLDHDKLVDGLKRHR